MNIVELIMSQMGGDTPNKLGSLIGENRAKTESAVGAAVPALLAGLTKLVSKPEGSKQLDALLGKQDTGVLENFTSMLGSQGASVAEKGSGLLTSLLGGDNLAGLLGTLGKFTGLRQDSMGKLLGALAPLVLGVLGKQKSSMGLDMGGLANLLAGQKQNIMGAMPSGLGDALGALPGMAGLFDSAKSALGGAAAAARSGAAQVAGSAERAADSARAGAAQAAQQVGGAVAKTGSSIGRWLVPLVIIVGAIILFSRSKGCQRGDLPTAPDVSADASSVVSSIESVANSATQTLGTIQDAASADLALPKLREMNAKLDGLKALWDKIPATARAPIAAVAKSAGASLTPVLDKVTAIPEVGPKIKPIADEMLAKLAAFAQ